MFISLGFLAGLGLGFVSEIGDDVQRLQVPKP